MVIDLVAYRRRRAKPQETACAAVDEELICVNWGPAHILSVRPVVPAAPLPSPLLPDTDEDLAAFQALAYALATQI